MNANCLIPEPEIQEWRRSLPFFLIAIALHAAVFLLPLKFVSGELEIPPPGIVNVRLVEPPSVAIPAVPEIQPAPPPSSPKREARPKLLLRQSGNRARRVSVPPTCRSPRQGGAVCRPVFTEIPADVASFGRGGQGAAQGSCQRGRPACLRSTWKKAAISSASTKRPDRSWRAGASCRPSAATSHRGDRSSCPSSSGSMIEC
jgi:hypothetical protein